MKTILCPTDFSQSANNAMTFAARMAQSMKVDILLVHALHIPVVDAYAPATTVSAMMEEAEAYAMKKMANVSEELSKDFNIKVRTHLAFGLATDMVNKLESKEDISLVVLGTHGANNAIDVLLGTNASQIMSKSASPTLVIPKKASFDGIQKIGYATDFTEDSDSMIEYCVELMKPFKSELVVVHVAAKGNNPDHLDNLIAHLAQPINSKMIKGEDIAHELDAFIKEHGIQILAMKRHKRSWFDNLFHKSITKQMVYHSDVPILIFS